MDAAKIVSQLKDRNLVEVAKASGVSYSRVAWFVSGRTKEPAHSTVKGLHEYLERTNYKQEAGK